VAAHIDEKVTIRGNWLSRMWTHFHQSVENCLPNPWHIWTSWAQRIISKFCQFAESPLLSSSASCRPTGCRTAIDAHFRFFTICFIFFKITLQI